MIVELLICVAAAQDADRSTPEKALQTFAQILTDYGPTTEKLHANRQRLETLGDDLFVAVAKAKRIAFRVQVQRKQPLPKLLGMSFERIRKSELKDGVTEVQATQVVRMEMVDPASGQKKAESRQDEVRFAFVQVEGKWLIRSVMNGCKLCDGRGTCFFCEGKGLEDGKPCRDCEGRKACAVCKGSKEREETVPEFYFGMVSDQKIDVSADLSTAESAAQAFADVLTKTSVEESRGEIEIFRGMIAKYRECVTPEVARKLDETFTKAVADGTERFRTRRPKVEAFEKKEGRASALIREVVPPDLEKLRFKMFDHRIVLTKEGARWLVEQDQMGCSCEGKEGKCPDCKGTGWTDRQP